MSASIIAHWPGITQEQEEGQWAEFNNDYQDWANWMAEGLQQPEVLAALERAGVLPLATMTTEGVSDDEVFWASPADLRKAAARLSRLIDEGDPDAASIMESCVRWLCRSWTSGLLRLGCTISCINARFGSGRSLAVFSWSGLPRKGGRLSFRARYSRRRISSDSTRQRLGLWCSLGKALPRAWTTTKYGRTWLGA